MDSIKCPECKFENADDAVRCTNCGWPLRKRRQAGKTEPNKVLGLSPKDVAAIFGLVFITFAGALLKSWAE